MPSFAAPLEALYVTVPLTFSSIIIIVKLLSDKRELDSLHGRIAVGFLIAQDLAAAGRLGRDHAAELGVEPHAAACAARSTLRGPRGGSTARPGSCARAQPGRRIAGAEPFR
jgi:hypothetical protein